MTYVALLGFNLLFSGRFHSAFPVRTSFAPSLYIHLLMHIIWMFCWLQLNMSINWNQYIIPLLKPVSLVILTSVMIIPSRNLDTDFLVFPFLSDTFNHHVLQIVSPKFYPYPCYCCPSSGIPHPWLPSSPAFSLVQLQSTNHSDPPKMQTS